LQASTGKKGQEALVATSETSDKIAMYSAGSQQQQQQEQQQQQLLLRTGMKPDFYNQHSSTQGNAVDLCRQLLLQAASEMPLKAPAAAAAAAAAKLQASHTQDEQQQQQQQQLSRHCCCCCINVAEWGCSHGANSIAPVLLIADVLQQRLAAAAKSSSGSSSSASPEFTSTTTAETAPKQQQQQQQQEVHFSHVDVPSNDFSALFKCTQQYSSTLQQTCPLLHVTTSAVGASMYSRNFPARSLSLGFSFSSLHWQSSRAVRLSRTVNPGCSKVSRVWLTQGLADPGFG
jgi:hypothetical protein